MLRPTGHDGTGRREDGYALAVTMACVALVAVALTSAALAAGYGVLSVSRTRQTVDVRMAATERAAGDVPAGNGGSIAPAAPVTGFYDFVATDPATGRMRSIGSNDVPQDGEIALRQWRITSAGPGTRLFEVSAVLVDARSRTVVAGPRGAAFVMSRVVE